MSEVFIMFTLSPETIEYIKKNGGNVFVEMHFSAALGG